MISVEIAWLSPSGLAVRKEREMPRAVASELGASGGLSFEAGRAESPLRHPQPRRPTPPSAGSVHPTLLLFYQGASLTCPVDQGHWGSCIQVRLLSG